MNRLNNDKNSLGAVPRVVGIWLMIGVAMVVVQILIGGITRLTNSGLSITEWNVIGGVIPPLNTEQWEAAFQAYKDHTVQFEQIHADMDLAGFKFIYFWEWFHRLWARSISIVFIIPFCWFWYKGYFNRAMWIKLLGLVSLGALVGLFGWIMVKSGLNTPELAWVSAYKLTIHLSLALIVLGYVLWLSFQVMQPEAVDGDNAKLKSLARWTFGVAAVQIILGGLMSGMKAGLMYPYFPVMQSADVAHLTLNGSYVPDVLFQSSEWNVDNMMNYQKNAFAPALVQLLHRGVAYLLTVLVLVFAVKVYKSVSSATLRRATVMLLTALFTQVSLGIITLINCFPTVPAFWGVLHQGGAILLLSVFLYVLYQFSGAKQSVVVENESATGALDYGKGVVL